MPRKLCRQKLALHSFSMCPSGESSGSRKRGVEFKGGSLHDGFGGFEGFGGSGEHVTLRLLVLQNTAQ